MYTQNSNIYPPQRLTLVSTTTKICEKRNDQILRRLIHNDKRHHDKRQNDGRHDTKRHDTICHSDRRPDTKRHDDGRDDHEEWQTPRQRIRRTTYWQGHRPADDRPQTLRRMPHDARRIESSSLQIVAMVLDENIFGTNISSRFFFVQLDTAELIARKSGADGGIALELHHSALCPKTFEHLGRKTKAPAANI